MPNFTRRKTLGLAVVFVAVAILGLGVSVFDGKSKYQKQYSVFSSNFAESMSELLDTRHAVAVLPESSYTNQVRLQQDSLDLSVGRRDVLRTIFTAVTAGQFTDQAKIETWVRYLQDRIAHPKDPPIFENGQAIYDPLWLLKNRIAHCGQTNRLVVDGLEAAGFKTRVVQLKAHVAAEVWLDGGWRFLDADWLNLGQFVRNRDGALVSALEIHNNPLLLEGLRPGLEFKMYPIDVLGDHPSYHEMFVTEPYYYYKTSTVEQEKNEYYGWNYYRTVKGEH
jgi:hypothetical protein